MAGCFRLRRHFAEGRDKNLAPTHAFTFPHYPRAGRKLPAGARPNGQTVIVGETPVSCQETLRELVLPLHARQRGSLAAFLLLHALAGLGIDRGASAATNSSSNTQNAENRGRIAAGSTGNWNRRRAKGGANCEAAHDERHIAFCI